MTVTSRTPTARELVAAKQQAAASKPTATAVSAAPAQAREIVPATSENYRQRYLDEVSPSGLAGRRIKFSKEGRYVTADDEREVPETAEFIALCDQTLVGWLRFQGVGEPPISVMGGLYEGFVMPVRESLGDTDPAEWDLGLDNQPSDCWQHHMYLVLQAADTSELFTFTTSSRTGRRAVGNLLKHFDRMSRTHPDEYPVVRLGRGGFEHKDKRVGFVNTPTLVVVGRAPRDSAAKPDTSISAFLNDKVPHL